MQGVFKTKQMKSERIEIRITKEQKEKLFKYCTDKGTNITALLCTYIDNCTDKTESVRTAPKETQPTEQPQIEAPKVNVSSLSIAQIMKQKRAK
jgi:hypothetical protein